ncbi:MAG: hypothetical protein IJN69_01820, partial [Oscillospiraceae bacterium]|nr:hypothetical protein [Oscillospiraceae bacterium]
YLILHIITFVIIDKKQYPNMCKTKRRQLWRPPTRKHKPDFRHKEAAAVLSSPALHKVVLRVSALQQHFFCKNRQKCIRHITLL